MIRKLFSVHEGTKGYQFQTADGSVVAYGEYGPNGFEMIYGDTITTWKNAMMAFSYLNKVL